MNYFTLSMEERLELYRQKKALQEEANKRQLVIDGKKELSEHHFLEDVLQEYWTEFEEIANRKLFRENAEKAIQERIAKRENKSENKKENTSCFALTNCRLPVFNTVELLALRRSQEREREEAKEQKRRQEAIAKALYIAEKIQPVKKSSSFGFYRKKQKIIIVRKNGKTVKFIVPRYKRFTVKKENKPFTSVRYQYKNNIFTSKAKFVCAFPDSACMNSDSILYPVWNDIIPVISLQMVKRSLYTNFCASGNPVMFDLYTQAVKQLKNYGAMDYNNPVYTEVKTSKRYRDSITGKMMLREIPVMKQSIVYDSGKELDFTGKIQGETKVNKEEFSFPDVMDLSQIVAERICLLIANNLIQIPSQISFYRGTIYDAMNQYIEKQEKKAKAETMLSYIDDDGEEVEISIPVFDNHSEIMIDSIVETLKTAISSCVGKRFDIENAINAYILFCDGATKYELAYEFGKDEKQIRRWIETVENCLQLPEVKQALVNLL